MRCPCIKPFIDASVVIIVGDDVLLVPEEVQKEVPPSYAQAQADAVPPYWETTIHAPSAANTPGDVIIDSLPTGSLFSFLWNMLVSISFQFVGFLLTYLLHTTHAAKLGSRAGLGITLIQYGFAMRGKDTLGESEAWTNWKAEEPRPTFNTAAEAEDYYKNLTSTIPAPTQATVSEGSYVVGDATSEWLSFLLMTIGTCSPHISWINHAKSSQDGSSSSRPSSATGVSSDGSGASFLHRMRPPQLPRRKSVPAPRRSSIPSNASSGCRAWRTARSFVKALASQVRHARWRWLKRKTCQSATRTSSLSIRPILHATSALRVRTRTRHGCTRTCGPLGSCEPSALRICECLGCICIYL